MAGLSLIGLVCLAVGGPTPGRIIVAAGAVVLVAAVAWHLGPGGGAPRE